VRGTDHEREGSPCADAWAYALSKDGGVVICVCDGAGSAIHGDVGARCVTDAVVAALRDLTPWSTADALPDACAQGRAALLREAARRAISPAELACTLVVLAAWQETATIAHIGDGAVVGRLSRTGELRLLSAPERGEFANETWFISSASWQQRLRLCQHEAVSSVCVFTDGCERASLHADQTPFAPFWTPLFDFAAAATDTDAACGEISRLLDGDALRRSSGDDKTLAIAVLEP